MIEASHHQASLIARRSRSNFVRSFALLPYPKRRAMTALYAFARVTDDLGDQSLDPVLNSDRLAHWRGLTMHALAAPSGNQTSANHSSALSRDQRSSASLNAAAAAIETAAANDRPMETEREILPALADSCRQFSIPDQYLLGIIDGVLADQTKTRFADWQELNEYCYLVASTVGLACMHIWGFRPPLPLASAIQCGIAFQLTNILRDVAEDARRDRIYVPQSIWQPLGLTADDWLRGAVTRDVPPQIPAAMRQVATVARQAYADGWTVMESLHPDGQRMFSMMWRTYRYLLQAIESNPIRAIQHRTRVPFRLKAWVALTHASPWTFQRLSYPSLQ